MGKEETEEIKQINIEINELYITAQSVDNQIKKLSDKKRFLEMLP